MRIPSEPFARSRSMGLYGVHYIKALKQGDRSRSAMEDRLAVVLYILRPLESLPKCNESESAFDFAIFVLKRSILVIATRPTIDYVSVRYARCL